MTLEESGGSHVTASPISHLHISYIITGRDETKHRILQREQTASAITEAERLAALRQRDRLSWQERKSNLIKFDGL